MQGSEGLPQVLGTPEMLLSKIFSQKERRREEGPTVSFKCDALSGSQVGLRVSLS